MNVFQRAIVAQAVAVACAQGSICTSAKFRQEFLAGWVGSVDEAAESTGLAKYGDAAVPCLREIALKGGREIGDPCIEDPTKCESWAIKALTEIQTPTSRKAVVGLLERVKNPVTLGNLVSAIGIAKIREAREAIRKVLGRAEPHVQAQAVVALGSIGTETDLEAMLRVAHALPADNEDDIVQAVVGIEMLASPAAIGPLEQLARETRSEWVRKNIEMSIARLRTKRERNAPDESLPSDTKAP